MGKMSLDLNSFKAAGIYTLEVDNTARLADADVESLRMLVGFSNKGPFNRPVLLQEDNDRLRVFGDVDTKLEHKGCFFNRMLRTLLTGGPVIALNLLDVSTAYSGPDQVNFAALSMNAAEANPEVAEAGNYGEYDYLADSVDRVIYGTVKGDNLPYVGKTPFASVFNRSRFWIPDKDLLTAEATRNLGESEGAASYTFENGNLLNFANVGTEEISILVFKPASMPGYEVTAESWFGGRENIPFGWIRPYDNISDYFLQVVCVKGNWTNYPVLSTDPVWKGYFDKKGIKKNRVNQFMSAEGITVLGSWTGSIIPDFTDKQGNMLSLEKKVNAATERTGLLMSFNQDLSNVLTYDYSGMDATSSDPDSGCWGLDIDNNGEIAGEGAAKYIVDMVGHGAFVPKESVEEDWRPEQRYHSEQDVVDIACGYFTKNESRNKYYEAKTNLLQLISSSDVELPLYEKVGDEYHEIPGVHVTPGKFIPAQFINAECANVKFTKPNVAALVNNKYYEVTATGTLAAGRELYLTVDVDEEIIDSTATAVATFTLDDNTYHVVYKVCVNSEGYITDVFPVKLERLNSEVQAIEPYYGINFLSYNYIAEKGDGVEETITSAKYFSDRTLWAEEMPVSEDTKNMFIITNKDEWTDAKIKLGDYVHNITYNNVAGETEEYQLIPGLTKVIRKQFVQFNDGEITYQGKRYEYTGEVDQEKGGFYLITCTSPVLIENDEVVRQLPISDDKISASLRFIPMKGLTVTSRHRPGYDENGQLNIEEGIEKVYKVLNDEGIKRGLMNPQMVNFRYLIDSMSYGLGSELGGKRWLSITAKDRQKCTAILNLPSAKQFAVSSNPYFCKTYIPGAEARPSFDTKYIPDGGNTEMGSTVIFSLPSEEDGAKFTACFWPHLIYKENGKEIIVPPAADVANVLNRKFNGLNDPYAICANGNGILSNRYLAGIEFPADIEDRKILEPFGVNTIIKDQGSIMIYGNQTAYQAMKSDFNKLHVRENLNTAEIECEKILKRYNFLYNTPATRANIVQQLTPILQAMQVASALVKYDIICDETNNTPEVIEADTCVVEINLWMNHGMEKIVQVYTLQRLSDE